MITSYFKIKFSAIRDEFVTQGHKGLMRFHNFRFNSLKYINTFYLVQKFLYIKLNRCTEINHEALLNKCVIVFSFTRFI